MLTVVLPICDEEGNIPRIPGELLAELERIGEPWELVCVDDGSSDRSPALLRDLAAKEPRVRVETHRRNLGLGRAVRTGIAAARGDFIVTLDADFTFKPSLIADLLRAQREADADCVTSSPLAAGGALEGVPLHRRILTIGSNTLYRHLFGLRTTGITGLLRLYRASVVKGLRLTSEGFTINAEILAEIAGRGGTIVEIPATLGTREHGTTKARLVLETARHLRLIASLLWRRHGRSALPPLGLFAIVLAVHAKTALFDFVNWDDPSLLTEHPFYDPLSWASFATMWNPLALWRGEALDYSPVRDTSYAVDLALFGLRPGAFHLSQVAVHGVNAVVAFALLRRFLLPLTAFAVVGVWALHPVNVEAVVWISARKDVLMGLFFLLAGLAFTSGRAGLALLFGALCILCKPVGAVVGLLGLGPTSAVPRSPRRRLVVGALIALGAALVALSIAAHAHTGTVLREGGALRQWPAALQVVPHALRTIVAPVSLSARYAQELGLGWASPRVVIGLVGAVAWLAALVVAWRRGAPVAVALAFTTVAFLPYVPVVPINIWMADRYLYLTSLGVLWVVGALVEAAAGSRRLAPARSPRARRWVGPVRVAGVAIGLGCCGAASFARADVWESSVALWTDTVQKAPSLYYVWDGLGDAHMRAGDPRAALAAFERATKIKPDHAQGHANLAAAAFALGDFGRALAAADAARAHGAEADLRGSEILFANVDAANGRVAQAERSLRSRLARLPSDARAWVALGDVLASSGREAEALAAWERALALGPADDTVRLRRAALHASRGDCARAMDELAAVRAPALAADALALRRRCAADGRSGVVPQARGAAP